MQLADERFHIASAEEVGCLLAVPHHLDGKIAIKTTTATEGEVDVQGPRQVFSGREEEEEEEEEEDVARRRVGVGGGRGGRKAVESRGRRRRRRRRRRAVCAGGGLCILGMVVVL